jgi:hypothetical protein
MAPNPYLRAFPRSICLRHKAQLAPPAPTTHLGLCTHFRPAEELRPTWREHSIARVYAWAR